MHPCNSNPPWWRTTWPCKPIMMKDYPTLKTFFSESFPSICPRKSNPPSPRTTSLVKLPLLDFNSGLKKGFHGNCTLCTWCRMDAFHQTAGWKSCFSSKVMGFAVRWQNEPILNSPLCGKIGPWMSLTTCWGRTGRLCWWTGVLWANAQYALSSGEWPAVPNSKHWFTTSLEEGAGKRCSEFGGRCRKAVLGVCCSHSHRCCCWWRCSQSEAPFLFIIQQWDVNSFSFWGRWVSGIKVSVWPWQSCEPEQAGIRCFNFECAMDTVNCITSTP